MAALVVTASCCIPVSYGCHSSYGVRGSISTRGCHLSLAVVAVVEAVTAKLALAALQVGAFK